MRFSKLHAQTLLLLGALALRLSSTPGANVSYLVLALFALSGRMQAVQALMFSWLFSMLSPGIAPEATGAAFWRYAVLGGAALSLLLHSGVLASAPRVTRTVFATILLAGFLVIHSVLVSPMVDVSVLKTVSWALAMTTLFAAWSDLSCQEQVVLFRQVLACLILVLLCSLPLIFHPVGYLRNGTGFQGVLNHPQAFGPTAALVGAWAGSRIVSQSKPSWSLVTLFGLCLLLVFLSEARTAGLALVTALVMAAPVTRMVSKKNFSELLPGLKSGRVHILGACCLILVILATPLLSTQLDSYFTKRSDSSTLLEAYDASRGAKIREMAANIAENPIFGIGFGVASDPSSMVVERDTFFGLPVGAAVEKGVLPVAVIEEVGAFGLLAVVLWLLVVARSAGRSGDMSAITLLLTVLLLNMGESMFFSAGGMGLVLLILFAWSASVRGLATEMRR